MFTKPIIKKYQHHARLYHHNITSHPHYELISAHIAEFMAIFFGIFLAIGFGSVGGLLPNETFIYPLQEISLPECKFIDWEELGDDCKTQLPHIEDAQYSKYTNNELYRGVYSVLWGANYEETWENDEGGHSGVDFRTSLGTPTYSIGNGIVIEAENEPYGYGNVVKIKYLTPTNDVVYAVYAHLDTYIVSVGEKVAIGQQVGTVGNTGISFGVHMHYEINTTTRRGKNLYPYLDCAEKDPITQNDTTVCRDLLAEHSDDPIVFHEKYKDQGTIVASEDTFHGSAEPESEEVEDVVIEEETTDEIVVDEVSIDDDDDTNDNQEENEEEIDSNLSDTNTGVDISPNFVTYDFDEDIDLTEIYDLIKDNIPDLNTETLSPTAQRFLDLYSIEISHPLHTTVPDGDDIRISINITDKETGNPLNGQPPIDINVIPINTALKATPTVIDNLYNGKSYIKLLGKRAESTILVFTIEDKVFYALPVVVTE